MTTLVYIGGYGRSFSTLRSKQLELADVKVDEAWKDAMPATYRALVAPFSFFLRRRYGYA